MTKTYRKMNGNQLRDLYHRLQGMFSAAKDNYEFIQKYYPDTAYEVVIQIDSQYNDEYYKNSVRYVEVLDINGNELVPLKETARECRGLWNGLYLGSTDNDYGNGTREPINDIKFYMNLDDVDVYYLVKE